MSKSGRQRGGCHYFRPRRTPIQNWELALWLQHEYILFSTFHGLVFLEAHHLAEAGECFSLINGVGKIEVSYLAAGWVLY